MAERKKSSPKKSPPTKKRAQKVAPKSFTVRLQELSKGLIKKVRTKYNQFLQRRPHRSFQLTRRRDYVRSLKIPGYVAFTLDVNRLIRSHWRLFLLLTLLGAGIAIALGAITSSDVYVVINGLLNQSSKDLFGEGLGQIGQAAVIALSAFASNGTGLSAEQSIYYGFSLFLLWLVTVWLVREIVAGRKPRLRDGLYNATAPLLSTVSVVLALIVQLLPIAIIMMLYAALTAAGLLIDGFGSMLFWLFACAVGALVLYWITSTIIAFVVVTIPGMYPFRALKLAGDLVVGRRVRVMLRLLWGLIGILLVWMVALIVAILIDNLVKHIWPATSSFSFVPYIGALVSAFAMIWYASYVYLFYRKVVDDDAAPA